MIGPLDRRRIRKRSGASAVREYEKLKKEWRAKHRVLFWGLGTVAVLVFFVTWVAARDHPWPYFGGVLSGALLMGVGILRESPPPWIENYQVGAWGEERTAKAVQPLLKAGWVIVHDVKRLKFNLDHVLVGPGGVFVLDTKNFPGTAQVKGDRLRITRPDGRAGYDGPDLARRARGQGIELNRMLRQRCGISSWVSAVIVLWADFPSRAVAGDRMSYVPGDHLVEWLSAQPARLNAKQIEQIASVLQPGQRRRSRQPNEAPSQP